MTRLNEYCKGSCVCFSSHLFHLFSPFLFLVNMIRVYLFLEILMVSLLSENCSLHLAKSSVVSNFPALKNFLLRLPEYLCYVFSFVF